MALMGSALGSEVGLRLLLSPGASNVILRTACTVVGVGFPVYSTHKAIERKDPAEQELWCVYWAAYGCFSVAEMLADKLLSWFPCYYHVKFVFLIWLQLPNNFGARHLYSSLLRPFLLKHQNKLDRIVDGTRNDVNKFVMSHQQEILAVKKMVQRMATTAYLAAEEALRATRAVEGTHSQPSTSSASSPPEQNLTGLESVTGYPVEDPSWIEVPSAENLRERSIRDNSRR